MIKKAFFSIVLLMTAALTAMAAGHPFTLVIDAGHGGHDKGAPGAISKEKDLTLKYALAFGRLVEKNCPDVKVIYTRKTDKYITLYDRADIANNAKADLFISIHINALDGNHSAHGFQSYTLGRGQRTGDRGLKQNLEVAKRENSVIFMEKDYKKVYKGLDLNSPESDIMFEFIADKNREQSVELSLLMQKEVCAATGRQDGGAHQNNLAVLRLTSMPATLLELGFISTPDEEQFLNTDDALDRYSKGIYNAFIKYKNKYDTHISVPYRTSSSDRSGQLIEVVPYENSSNGDGSQAPAATSENNRRSSRNADSEDADNSKSGKNNASRRSSSTRNSSRNSDNSASASSKKNTSKSSSQRLSAPKAKFDPSKPVFKIQLIASSRKLKLNDKLFKGLEGCDYYDEGGLHKYTFGASNDYNEIYRLRKQILDKFPESFIIAFKNGAKMNINEAISEFKQNR